jgi:preprotein translocase subunit YajC
MVVMFLRTSARQKRELQNALASLKKNDKVVTSSGIIGVVVAVKENEDEVTLKTDDASNTRIRVLKSTIAKITSGDQTTGETKTS